MLFPLNKKIVITKIQIEYNEDIILKSLDINYKLSKYSKIDYDHEYIEIFEKLIKILKLKKKYFIYPVVIETGSCEKSFLKELEKRSYNFEKFELIDKVFLLDSLKLL